MATTQEAISRLSIQSTLTGEAEVTAGLKRISAAQDGVAVSSSSSERATVSLEKSFANIERRYVAGVAAQQQYKKTQDLVNAAVQQNPALQDRANVVMAEAAKRHDVLTGSQKALGVVANDLNSRIQANAGSFGVLGQALSALGPVGVGIAATMGVVIGVLYAASSASHALAEKAKEIREFSEATGLTTTQFQALRSEAGKFGIDSETLSHGLSKFTAGYDELRKGGGQLLTDIRKINPALANQMQVATDSATAFTLFGKAVQQTDNIFQRNALLKAGLGKGSAVFGAFFESAPDVAKLTDAFAAAGKGLDENLIKKLAILNADIARTQSAASTVFASVFAESVLTSERQFAGVLLDIAKTFKLISETSVDLPKAVTGGLNTASRLLALTNPIGLQIEAAKYLFKKGAEASDAKAASPANFVSPANDYLKFQAGATPVAPKTPGAIAADWKNYISVIGSAATPTEKLNAAIAELGIKAKEAGREGADLARGIAALKLDDAIAGQSAHNAVLGASTSVTETVRLKTLELAKARQQDSTLTDTQVKNVQRVTAEQALGTYQIQSQIDAEKIRSATLFMGAEAALAYATSQTIINKAVQDGKPLTEEEIERIKRKAAELAKLNVANTRTGDLLKVAQQSGASFSTDLISGLGQGLTAVEALHGAFKNLASTLTSSAMKSLFDGDFVSAGIKGIAAITAAIFSANTSSSGEKWLAQQKDAMATRLQDYQGRITLAGIDTNTRAGAILAQDQQFIRERIAENKAGGQAMNTLLKAEVDERNALLADWDKKETDLVKSNADAKLAIEKAAADRSLGFQDRLFAATNDFETLQGQLAAFDRTAQQDRLTEVQNGGQAIVDLEAAQAAERYNVIKSFNDKTLAAVNATAKGVTDYLNGLVAGPGSTQSPIVTLASAQTLYQANLPLAQAGNVDAQNKWVGLADNLEKALRTVYASGEGYQIGRNQIINQGLNLPAVQATTDPVTAAVRDAITAIQIGNAALNVINATAGGTTSAVNSSNSVGTLTGQILPAVNAGNAAAVAASLATYFNSLNTAQAGTTSAVSSGTGTLLPAVNAGNAAATAAALTSLFNQIDPSGTLSNILGTTGQTAISSNNAQFNAYQTKVAVDGNNALVTAGNNLVTSSNIFLTGINTFTDRIIQAINAQGVMQAGNFGQMILNSAILLNWMPKLVTTGKENAGGDGGGASTSFPYTAHAMGGVIPPYGLGLVSEHSPGGGRFIRAGAEPIAVSPFPATPVFRGGNDNSRSDAALLARIDKLTEQVENLQKVIAASGNQVSQTIVKKANEQIAAVGENGKRIAYATNAGS